MHQPEIEAELQRAGEVLYPWVALGAITIEQKNNRLHWIIRAGGIRWDFWPSTGKWQEFGSRTVSPASAGLYARIATVVGVSAPAPTDAPADRSDDLPW